MEEYKTPLENVLKDVADALGNIMVPAVLTEQVGVPIALCRRQLLECVSAIERDKKTGEEADQDV